MSDMEHKAQDPGFAASRQKRQAAKSKAGQVLIKNEHVVGRSAKIRGIKCHKERGSSNRLSF